MIRAEEEGTTSIWPVLSDQSHCNTQNQKVCWFLDDVINNQIRPRSLILGTREDMARTSPIVWVHDFDFIGVELHQHGEGGWSQMNPDLGGPKKVAP
jgi:hypothetical protein